MSLLNNFSITRCQGQCSYCFKPIISFTPKRRLEIISRFKNNPVQYLKEINQRKGIKKQSIALSESYIHSRIDSLNPADKKAVDFLSGRLDALNNAWVSDITPVASLENFEVKEQLEPIERIGIYIPRRMPSSAYTFLSAAQAAGVRDIVLYLAQDDEGEADPLTLYVAEKYQVNVVSGPARIAFPVMAMGFEEIRKCDMICGPCGANMNILKNLSGLIGRVAVDMSAGPSDLTVVVDLEDKWEIIFLDLLSQLEHGPDSSSTLIIVGDKSYSSFLQSPFKQRIEKVPNIKVELIAKPDEVSKKIMQLAPETLEIYSSTPAEYHGGVKYCGVVYHNA